MIGNQVTINSIGYGAKFNKTGYFAIAKKVNEQENTFSYIQTHHCRETFSRYFNSKTCFVLFLRLNISLNRVNKFFGEIETKLGIKNPSEFCPTNNKHIILIKPSYFWRVDGFRRGMFTLFLRCAACYYNNDVYEALTKYPLSKRILGPIEWFMKGNTNLSQKVGGGNMVNYFSGMGRSDWQGHLTKFKFKKKKNYGVL